MCANYESISDPVRLAEHFNVLMPSPEKFEIFPGYESIFIRRPKEADAGDEAVPDRESALGVFGMVPHWTRAKDVKVALVSARRTYNARSETVTTKPSFRDAWKNGHHCVVPAEGIFEFDHATDPPVRHRISRIDGKPMGIAGLWTGWKSPEGHILRSFTMLTINSDDHELMKRFHAPGDEKRMVVILNEDSYDAWLKCPPEKSMEFMRQYPAELLRAVPAPLPPRKKKKPEAPTEL